jgi:hypothetical protein
LQEAAQAASCLPGGPVGREPQGVALGWKRVAPLGLRMMGGGGLGYASVS